MCSGSGGSRTWPAWSALCCSSPCTSSRAPPAFRSGRAPARSNPSVESTSLPRLRNWARHWDWRSSSSGRRTLPGGREGTSVAEVKAMVSVPWRRLSHFLPTGANLTAMEFQQRHRVIVWLVLLQDAGLLIFGLARHVNPLAVVLECAVIAGLGGMSAVPVLSPRFRAAVATVALVITSSVVVQFSGGYIEAHFHFFVMLAVVFLYQDWIPFLLAIAYVALDHGLVGSLFPGAVYNHPSALAHPLQWALIHAAFVLAESAALIAGWKIIERTEDLRRSELTRFNQELARHARSLAQSEEEARQANATKSEFLASMSHELRTPMTSILGFGEVLADG